MVDATVAYVVSLSILFFFWIYGIVAFVRDLKNYVVPASRRYRRNRRDDGDAARADRDREEREQQLY